MGLPVVATATKVASGESVSTHMLDLASRRSFTSPLSPSTMTTLPLPNPAATVRPAQAECFRAPFGEADFPWLTFSRRPRVNCFLFAEFRGIAAAVVSHAIVVINSNRRMQTSLRCGVLAREQRQSTSRT